MGIFFNTRGCWKGKGDRGNRDNREFKELREWLKNTGNENVTRVFNSPNSLKHTHLPIAKEKNRSVGAKNYSTMYCIVLNYFHIFALQNTLILLQQ